MNNQNNNFINHTIGAIDGILGSFLIYSFLYFFIEKNLITSLLLTLAGLSIIAIIYGMTRFLGEQQEIDHQHPQYSLKDQEKEDRLLEHIGIESGIRMEMKEKITHEKELWLSEIKENHLNWEHKSKKRALSAGFQTASGFLISGCVFLFPVLFFAPQLSFFNPFIYWFFMCLFIAGGIKSKYIGKPFFSGGLQALIYGLLMIASLFLVNKIFF